MGKVFSLFISYFYILQGLNMAKNGQILQKIANWEIQIGFTEISKPETTAYDLIQSEKFYICHSRQPTDCI